MLMIKSFNMSVFKGDVIELLKESSLNMQIGIGYSPKSAEKLLYVVFK